jgi:hypothetical protein
MVNVYRLNTANIKQNIPFESSLRATFPDKLSQTISLNNVSSRRIFRLSCKICDIKSSIFSWEPAFCNSGECKLYALQCFLAGLFWDLDRVFSLLEYCANQAYDLKPNPKVGVISPGQLLRHQVYGEKGQDPLVDFRDEDSDPIVGCQS